MQRVIASGLFGLGLPEVAVVAGIAVLVFGEPCAAWIKASGGANLDKEWEKAMG